MPARRTPLSDDQIAEALPEGWRHETDGDESRLEQTFSFESFREAFAFLTRVAFEAEALDHHPEIANVYDTVHLSLSTHDAGNRVTETDLDLARRVSAI